MSRPRGSLLPPGARGAALSALIAYLYALGLALPILATTGLEAYLPNAVLACAGLTLLWELLLLPAKRLRRLKTLATLALAALAALFFGRALVNIGTAVYLWITDSGAALRVYAAQALTLLFVLITALSRYATQESAGVAEPLFLACVTLLSVRAAQAMDNALYAVPAALSLLVILSRAGRMQTPAKRALPVALLLAALALALVPSGRTTVKPFSDAAASVRQYIEDRFFFTEARNNFSLTDEGYQPLGAGQLGGPASQEEHEVLSVDTARDVYLRATAMDTYTGRTWRDTLNDRRYVYHSLRHRSLRETLFDENTLTGDTLPVTVRVLRAGTSTLFVPQRLRELSVPGGVIPYFSASTEVFIPRDIAPGDSYALSYLPLIAGSAEADALVARYAQSGDARYDQVAAQYLGVPSHLQREVYDIAARATAGASTPYEQALAIQRYLQTNYPYTLDVASPPVDMDFVAYFLLAERKGYCTYFASAMTILCRIAGLPARYVTGFYVPANETGTTIVRGKNAHAWTEVYFRGVGWLTLDATAPDGSSDDSGDEPPQGTPPPATPTPSPEPSPSPTPEPPEDGDPPPTPTPEPDDAPPPATEQPSPEPRNTPPESPENRPPFPWLWLLAIAAAALLAWRIVATQPERRARKLPPAKALPMLYAACERALALRGLSRRPQETPLAFAVRAQQACGVPFVPLTLRLCDTLYGKQAPESADIAQAKTTYRALHATLNRRQAARLALRRAI